MLIKKIENLADKKKWMERFRRAYSGELESESDKFYKNNVIFLVATEKEKELGFIRINDKTSFFSQYTSKLVWNLTDGYVKPPYRNKGVLKELIKYSIKHHDVKMMFIETTRFLANQPYYSELGFTKFYSVREGQLTWAFQEDIWTAVQQRNESST